MSSFFLGLLRDACQEVFNKLYAVHPQRSNATSVPFLPTFSIFLSSISLTKFIFYSGNAAPLPELLAFNMVDRDNSFPCLILCHWYGIIKDPKTVI